MGIIRALIYYICSLLLFATSCRSVSDVNKLDSIVRKKSGKTWYLKSGVFKLRNTIDIPTGTILVGRKTTLIVPENIEYPAIRIKSVSRVVLKNINIRGEKLIESGKSNQFLNIYNTNYFLEIHNCENIKVENCSFSNSYGTVVHVSDCVSLDFTDCVIENIGVATSEKTNYSYDGIFLGGYKYTSDVHINRCVFRNIGMKFPSGGPPWPNDGDGIQIQSMGKIERIKIENCVFDRCSARGIKIQTGNNIEVDNNNFLTGWAGVCIVMPWSVSNIKLTNNILTDFKYPFGTDCYTDYFIVDNLLIQKNKVNKCEHFFRTSGKSGVKNAQILDNEIDDVGTFFISGRFYDTKVMGNKIKVFGTALDQSYRMAIEINEESDNLSIEGNSWRKFKENNYESVIFSKKRVIVKNNKMQEPDIKNKKE